jgi:Flp pilus assembly protein TadG
MPRRMNPKYHPGGRALGRARRCRFGRGTATVEFSLVAPLLLLLTAGVLDFALLVCDAASAADAARCGAVFGSLSVANSTNTSGMQSAALNAAPGLTGMTASASRSCQCSGGGSVSCSGSCSSGKMMIYVQVTTHATAPTIFNYSQLGFSGTVGATASMRAQ